MRVIPYVQPDLQGWLEKFNFSIPIKVRYHETDMTGHINNVSYFIYFEQGRIDYLDHLQLTDDLFNEESVAVVADLECQFIGQILIRDPLKLYVRIAKLGRSSLDFEYAIVETSMNQIKAVGRGAMVHIDKKNGKSMPVPNVVREKIVAFEGQD
jgi:acyl-CoA thioester hydrolase